MIASYAILERERKNLPEILLIIREMISKVTNSSSHIPARQCLMQELSLDT